MWLASLSYIMRDSLDGVCNGPVMSCFFSFLYTQAKSDVGKVADTSTAGKAQEPGSSKTSRFARDGDVTQNDSKPIPYRGNPGIVIDHKSEDFDALDGNGQDRNDEGDDLNPEEKNDDDVMEEVFNAEQQRRMDLLGDAAEQKDDLNQMCVSDHSGYGNAQVCFTRVEFVAPVCSTVRTCVGLCS